MPETKRHRINPEEEQPQPKDGQAQEEQPQAGQPQDQTKMTSPDGAAILPEGQAAVEADVQALQHDLEECTTQSAAYFEGWQRERADFSNYRRRVEREQAQTYQNAAGNIIKKFLPIADDLARALKRRPTQGDAVAWADGIELIYRKLLSQVEAEGVHRMELDGQTFNPDLEEAISHEDSPDHESGQIIEVVQDGYMLGDRVLRPALVRVAR